MNVNFLARLALIGFSVSYVRLATTDYDHYSSVMAIVSEQQNTDNSVCIMYSVIEKSSILTIRRSLCN